MNIRRLFARRDRELDEEIQAHLTMAIRDRIERGENPQEAELAARLEFGNATLTRETTRDMWRWRFLEEIARDIRYALRGMRRSPGMTAVVVASLALGIGANMAIFSLVYSVMLRSLPVAHPEELVELLQKYPGEPRGNGYWSPRSYEHYRDHNHVFAALTGVAIDNVARVRAEGWEAEALIAEYVVGNYFEVLGLRPALGRLIGFEHDTTKPEGAVAVMSWSLWNSRFQANFCGRCAGSDYRRGATRVYRSAGKCADRTLASGETEGGAEFAGAAETRRDARPGARRDDSAIPVHH
jgi:hypothetical protein